MVFMNTITFEDYNQLINGYENAWASTGIGLHILINWYTSAGSFKLWAVYPLETSTQYLSDGKLDWPKSWSRFGGNSETSCPC